MALREQKGGAPEDDSGDMVLCVCDCVAIGKTVEDGVWLMRGEVKANGINGRRCWAVTLKAVNLWGRRLGVSSDNLVASANVPQCDAKTG